MNEITGSVRELAEKMGTDYQTALCVINFLVGRKIAKHIGIRPNPTGKGKGSNLFCLPTGLITLTLINHRSSSPGDPCENAD